jgi:hypothetical protein
VSDEDGNSSIIYDVNEIYQIGKYKIVIWAVAQYYRPNSIIGEFIAVERQ